jgi:hypothetical protein
MVVGVVVGLLRGVAGTQTAERVEPSRVVPVFISEVG